MFKKTLVFLLGALLVLSLTPALAQEAGGGGTLIGAFDVGPGGAQITIPFYDTGGRDWLTKIWSTLVIWNEDMSALQGELATEWYPNEDATVWTFKLREGVLWHDGEAFTADDVVFSLNLALNPEAGTNFSGISQIDRSLVASVTA